MLWPSADAAVNEMRAVLPLCDLVKVSKEDLVMLTGTCNAHDGAQALFHSMSDTACLCAVTCGTDGSAAASRTAFAAVPAERVKAVDTTGAGAIFWGAMLSALLDSGLPEVYSQKMLAGLLRFSNHAAGISVTRRGGILSRRHTTASLH